MMLDIVQAIIEWLLPLILPTTQLPKKTAIMTVRSAEPKLSPSLSSDDSSLPDSTANIFPDGLTGSHVMMVVFTVVTIWLVISNITTRIVEKGRDPNREMRYTESLGLPLKGIADESSGRSIWQDHFGTSDLKLKWIVQRHEEDLNQLQKHQIEQDIKFSYLSRRLSRRERQDILRTRPDLGTTKLQGSSDDEIETINTPRLSLKRCRCEKVTDANVERETRPLEIKGHGDHILEGKQTKEGILPIGLNSLGQGDSNQTDQFRMVQTCPGTPDPRQRGRLLGRPRDSKFDYFSNNEMLQNILHDKMPPKPPPRPDPPQKVKLFHESGATNSKLPTDPARAFHQLMDRLLHRHLDTEPVDSTESTNSSPASVSADVPRKDAAPVPESASSAEPPTPGSAT